MERARAEARDSREKMGSDVVGDALLERLKEYLTECEISLVAMSPEQMNGSKGEIDTEAGVLKYDRTQSTAELLLLFAHELGHLKLHKRLGDPTASYDPVLASAYGDAGPAAVARYSPRTYEESQAVAFSLEFICPSTALWNAWKADDQATLQTLASQFGCGIDIVRVQLSHALHVEALGEKKHHALLDEIEFTPAQVGAARHTAGPAIVDAGPGTGKTATVIERIRILVEDLGAEASQILALTFSNEAAQEMTDRVAATFGDEAADTMTIRTFHGFGMEFLHLHGHLAGYNEDFRLLDEDAQAELISSILGRVDTDRLILLRDPFETATRAMEHVNYCKHRLITPDMLDRAVAAWEPRHDERDDFAAAQQFANLFREYESAKQKAERIDFADLIAMPLRLLRENATIRSAYAEKFPWIIVDEFQDVTRATSQLLAALCGKTNPPWVVGDARQAIYQFLGAAPENVAAFAEDFEGAKVFSLNVNYRSSAPIVTVANQLASLLEKPDAIATDLKARWTPGMRISPLGDEPVAIAVATSDAAEIEGVADKVQGWITRDGISPGDIAVLARRHVDVRNVILALKNREIVAQASGLLTSEGSAGDLAVILTLPDAPAISIPRVAFALGRDRYETKVINATISGLLSELRGQGERPAWFSDELAAEIMRAYDAAVAGRHSCDGFVAMANFLFEHSGYLRRILDAPDSAERSMTLVEIVSALSLATNYRATHVDAQPAEARVAFAARFRVRLTKTLPIPLAPSPRPDAVHVMTCHASKGLEFPCVVVVGQTIPSIHESYDWIAPALRPKVSRENEQADSLLFVAVTRAKRAVFISYPERATAGTRGRGKTMVPLLENWQAAFGIPTEQWTSEAAPEGQVIAGNVWGAPIPTELKASVLDDSVCPLLTYLEKFHGARFPRTSELYPFFFSAVRQTLRAIAAHANETGNGVDETLALEMLNQVWPLERDADHDHAGIYRDAASRMATGFARAFRPSGTRADFDPETRISSSGKPDVVLDLISNFRNPDGSIVAIAFRPESLSSEPGVLKWSDLDKNKRISLVLLENAQGGTVPRVYSGDDERIYDYEWSRLKKSLPTQAEGLLARRDAFARGDFSSEPTKFGCERCRVRASCPHWIGAIRQT
jgi:superfamily I DNA/RNA helicase